MCDKKIIKLNILWNGVLDPFSPFNFRFVTYDIENFIEMIQTTSLKKIEIGSFSKLIFVVFFRCKCKSFWLANKEKIIIIKSKLLLILMQFMIHSIPIKSDQLNNSYNFSNKWNDNKSPLITEIKRDFPQF